MISFRLFSLKVVLHSSKFWAREPVTPGQLNSYEKIRTMVVNGSPLRLNVAVVGTVNVLCRVFDCPDIRLLNEKLEIIIVHDDQ